MRAASKQRVRRRRRAMRHTDLERRTKDDELPRNQQGDARRYERRTLAGEVVEKAAIVGRVDRSFADRAPRWHRDLRLLLMS
jgi:hypothetical protein